MVTLAPIASPAASSGRLLSAAMTAVTISSGSAPASSSATARALMPSRLPAPAAFSANSSAPMMRISVEPVSSSSPIIGRSLDRSRCGDHG